VSKEAVLAVPGRASDDINFYSQLVEDYAAALEDYDLTPAKVTAIGAGNWHWIESQISAKMDEPLVDKIFIPLLSREKW
jgi:hypothetical protein